MDVCFLLPLGRWFCLVLHGLGGIHGLAEGILLSCPFDVQIPVHT